MGKAKEMKVYGTSVRITNEPRLKPNTHFQYRVIVLASSRAAAVRAINEAGHHLTLYEAKSHMSVSHNDEELATAKIPDAIYARGIHDWKGKFIRL